MKDGMRFVDCDMHVMEPADIFDRYLDPRFKERVISAPGRAGGAQMVIDGLSRAGDDDLQQYRKRNKKVSANQRQPLSSSRSAPYLGFAIERNYDPIAQVMGMAFLLPATTAVCTAVAAALALTSPGLRRGDGAARTEADTAAPAGGA